MTSALLPVPGCVIVGPSLGRPGRCGAAAESGWSATWKAAVR